MKRPSVLVIEDNEQNLYLMRFLLEKNGFAVTEARDGQEGIRAACALVPDLILLTSSFRAWTGTPWRESCAAMNRWRTYPSLRSPPTPWRAIVNVRWPPARPVISRNPSIRIRLSINSARTWVRKGCPDPEAENVNSAGRR
jgi:CheY-like chemotaxis protein